MLQIVVSTRSQEQPAPQDQTNDNNILVQILQAFQGLAQSKLDTRRVIMDAI